MAKLTLGGTEAKNVYVGSTLAKAVYLGTTKVWPSKVVYTEVPNYPFTDGNGYWQQWIVDNDAEKPGAKSLNDTLGLVSIGQNGAWQPKGRYMNNGLLTNSHYFDVVLRAPLYGILDTGSSGEQLIFGMRCPLNSGTTKQMDFRIRGNGSIQIYSWSGSTGTQRASVTGKTYSAGQTLRMVAREDGFHAIYNKTTDPTFATPLASWTDSAKTILNYDVDHRNLRMSQGTNFPFLQQQYSCYAIKNYEYGDL